MSKKHTSYTSAFAIGEMAVLSLDRFGKNKVPYGVVEGCMIYGDQRMYRVSLFVNDGPANNPSAFLHQGRPVDGFLADDLKAITDYQYADHIGHVGRFEDPKHEVIGDSKFKVGQLVEVDVDLEREGEYDKFNIPVMITGVRYEEGKILYDVSIQRAYYEDGRIKGGRLMRDTLTNIDSVFIKPVGGWPETVVTLEGDNGQSVVVKGGSVTINSPKITLGGEELNVLTADTAPEEEKVLLLNDLFDAAYEAHLNGVSCGENNKEAARNFLAQYIREQDKRLEKFRAVGSATGRISGRTENMSAKPRSE